LNIIFQGAAVTILCNDITMIGGSIDIDKFKYICMV